MVHWAASAITPTRSPSSTGDRGARRETTSSRQGTAMKESPTKGYAALRGMCVSSQTHNTVAPA
jgi:hypothetical protein